MEQGHRWVIDADLAKYFDSIRHPHIRSFLDLRIRDGVVRRLIDKWLKAGILDQGILRRSKAGTPPGGVLSPLLSNVVLHHVLDPGFEDVAAPRLPGSCQLVRYADDFVITFTSRRSGERLLAVLGKRLGRYGLTLHATKTRYVDFQPTRRRPHPARPSFDFLGFTHVWARSRRGRIILRRITLRRITAKDRFARAVRAVHDWCKRHRHQPVAWQQEHLARVIRGHCGYYGVTGNGKRLASFRHQVIVTWRKWLSRRSRMGFVSWNRMTELLRRYPLPPARMIRSIYAH